MHIYRLESFPIFLATIAGSALLYLRKFIHLLILSMVLNSCHSKINNSIVDKTEVKNKIDYSDTFYGLRNKKEKDSYYFHAWTNVFDEKIDHSRHLALSSVSDMIKMDYRETAIIAKVKNLKLFHIKKMMMKRQSNILQRLLNAIREYVPRKYTIVLVMK